MDTDMKTTLSPLLREKPDQAPLQGRGDGETQAILSECGDEASLCLHPQLQ